MKLWRMLFIVGVSSTLVGTGAFGPPAKAMTFSGANGDISFTKTVQGKMNIWRMNAKGKHERPLTYRGAHSPAWSPSGRKLVFVDEAGRLQIMSTDGTRRQLTYAHWSKDSSPVWPADGSRIAFVREVIGSEQRAIFTVQLNNLHEKNITGWSFSGGYRALSWSPDGTQLAYEHFMGGSPGKLLIKNLRDHSSKELTTVSEGVHSQAAWSPNGKKILFSDSASEVYTIWPDGSHRTVISDGDSRNAAWSPEGTKIAFAEDDGISISEADGTVTPVPFQKGSYPNIDNLSWSPDGTMLLFTMSHPDADGHSSDIFSLDLKADTPHLAKLASGQLNEPDWQAKLP